MESNKVKNMEVDSLLDFKEKCIEYVHSCVINKKI